MTRTLVLKRESLTELDDAELLGVVGGDYSGQGLSCPLLDCLNYTWPPRCR